MSFVEVGAPAAIAPKMLLSRTGKVVIATLSVVLAAALLVKSGVRLPTLRGLPEHAQATVAKQGRDEPGRAEETFALASRRLTRSGREICEATLPQGTLQHSLITLNNAEITAENMYSRVTVGGCIHDAAPALWKVVDGKVTVGGTAPTAMWNFNGGLETGVRLSAQFEWLDFETLAASLLPGEYEGGFRVIIMQDGGLFTQADFGDIEVQAEDNGRTLVVFNTCDDIILDRAPDGRQFGPSVLAPFSKVTVLANTGFIDGFLVARELRGDWRGRGHLQMHGEGYTGPLEFPCSYLQRRPPFPHGR